jgi:hypothetical protein
MYKIHSRNRSTLPILPHVCKGALIRTAFCDNYFSRGFRLRNAESFATNAKAAA